MKRRRVGYLTAEYPLVSHTFIAREVAALRRLGVDVSTFSVRRTPEEKLLSAADRRAAGETFAILPVATGRLLGAHLRAAVTHPRRYVQTLARALSLSSGGVRAGVWQYFYFVEAIVLWDECRRRNITHLHAHFANVASAVTLLLAHFAADDGVTWSFTMHGPTEFDDVSRFALAEKIRSAAFVACISDYCRAQMMRLVEPSQWDKLTIVRCGLDAEHLTAVPPSPAEPGRPLRVLTIGRLVPDKGQMLLLRAVAQLRDAGVAVTLTLIGDGPDRAALERATRRLNLEACVEFTGSLGQSDVAERFQSADVFCLPSFAEGLPVVLMEAMARGLPVIATRIAGVAELVEDGVSGALVPAARVDELVTALRRLADEPDLRPQWGAAGRARVARDYDVNQSARVLARLVSGADEDDARPAPEARELQAVAP
ncbi:MAG TPA: glycosyltransferase [Solirubrobacteraceae bacterium]|nr:glycosyltransferase [Solirubrobacteraceae bacterium]